MNAYGSAPTWTLTTAKRRIQEWGREAGKERIAGESEENGCSNIVMKTPSFRVGFKHLRTHTHTHISTAFDSGPMEDSFNRSPNVVGDRDTHPPIATSETTRRKPKKIQKCNIHICPWNPFLPQKVLPREEGRNLRYLQISRCRQ